jgi:putative spermidine/putrescine transport system ATP-binding protein
VLMDEPLGALDKQLREQMQFEIKHIHQRLGVTVVYVTHDQTEALTMSDRIAVFSDGVIQQLSSAEDLYDKPANSFVAQFIGENNRLSGTIIGISGNICTVRLDSGQDVKALKIVDGGVGTRSSLSLRPERIEFNPDPKKSDNILPGQVQDTIFIGDHIRVRLKVAGSDEFVVKLRHWNNSQLLQAGAEIKLGWKAAECRALNEQAV